MSEEKYCNCCNKVLPVHTTWCQYFNQLPAPELSPEMVKVAEEFANARQVGGEHYKKGGEEHWDRAWRLKYDPFQYIITKWVERWRDKGGIQDLEKAQHAIQKYIEVVRADHSS